MNNENFYILKCQEKDNKILCLEKRISELEKTNNDMGLLLHVKAEITRNCKKYTAEKGLIAGFCDLYERNIALERMIPKEAATKA